MSHVAGIGIEPLLPLPSEKVRFRASGVKVLSGLFQQLSPYRQRDFSIEDFLQIADESACLLLAVDLEHNGHIVGVARLIVCGQRPIQHGVLHDEVVDPAYRGRGIGRRLTLEAIATARRLGLGHIELESKPARTTANLMYQVLGFQLIRAADPTIKDSANHYHLTL